MLNFRTSLYGAGDQLLAQETSGLSWNSLM
jgi:hypothetical protein